MAGRTRVFAATCRGPTRDGLYGSKKPRPTRIGRGSDQPRGATLIRRAAASFVPSNAGSAAFSPGSTRVVQGAGVSFGPVPSAALPPRTRSLVVRNQRLTALRHRLRIFGCCSQATTSQAARQALLGATTPCPYVDSRRSQLIAGCRRADLMAALPWGIVALCQVFRLEDVHAYSSGAGGAETLHRR